MLSNLERVELMRDRTKRARERLDKLEAARKYELMRDEATKFCKTVQDWHVYLWTVFNASNFMVDYPQECSNALHGSGKYAAMRESRDGGPERPWIGDVRKAVQKAHEDWKVSRKRPKPEGPPNRVYTNSEDFNEDQRRKRVADSIAETVTILIIVAVGYAFLIA